MEKNAPFGALKSVAASFRCHLVTLKDSHLGWDTILRASKEIN